MFAPNQSLPNTFDEQKTGIAGADWVKILKFCTKIFTQIHLMSKKTGMARRGWVKIAVAKSLKCLHQINIYPNTLDEQKNWNSSDRLGKNQYLPKYI